MPRYFLETHPFAGDLSRLLALAETRFPEVSLERRYALGGERDAWVCRAATATHIRRFARAAGIAVEALHRIDADIVIAGAGPATERRLSSPPRLPSDRQ